MEDKLLPSDCLHEWEFVTAYYCRGVWITYFRCALCGSIDKRMEH